MADLIPFSDVQAKLRDKVHAAFIELIPPEAFDAFVKQAWRHFAQGDSATRDGFGREVPATKPELVQMLEIEMRKVIQARVALWSAEWAKGDECSEAARAVLREITRVATREHIQSVAEGAIQTALRVAGLEHHMRCSGCGRSAPRNERCACGTYNS